MRFPERVAAGLALSALASLGPGAASAASFFASEGFEDDVDLIVAPNKEFLVAPVENESGSVAFLDLYDLAGC